MRAVIRPAALLTRPDAPFDSEAYWNELQQRRQQQVNQLRTVLQSAFKLRQANEVSALPGVGGLLIDDDWRLIMDLKQRTDLLVFDETRLTTIRDQKCSSCRASSGNFWHLKDTKIEGKRSGRGVHIGIMDSGLWTLHPELEHLAKSSRVAVCRGKAFEEIEAADALDEDGHGSSVASLIAGKQAGMAPEASVAVACAGMDPPSRVMVSAIAWLNQLQVGRRWGCDVLNLSVGLDLPGYYNEGFYKVLQEAKEQYGTTIVAAVGNSPYPEAGYHQSPGNYDLVLSVGAVDANSGMISLSAWGKVTGQEYSKPDLCAPGMNVWSADTRGDYSPAAGTSLATAVVSGACAVVIERRNLHRCPDDVKQLVMRFVRPLKAAYAEPSMTPNELAARKVGGEGCLDLADLLSNA